MSEENVLEEIIQIPLLQDDGVRGVKINIKEDIFPHNGEEITHIVCSPNVKYVATWSKDDRSICGWPVIEGQHQLNFDYSLTGQDLKSLPIRITTSDLKNVPTHVINYVDDFEAWYSLIDSIKQLFVFFKPTEEYKDTFYFDELYGIVDLKTKLLQRFNVQGLSRLSTYEAIRFLENGNLVIVKGDPIYRVYIFSFIASNGEHQWKCINVISLQNFHKCFILPKGKILFLTEIPFVITQWDLESLKFEAQYVLDLHMFKDKDYIDLQLNFDNTLLAVFNRKQDAVNIYSTSSSIMLSKHVFKDINTYGIIGVNFISSMKQERILVKFYKISYIMVPHSCDNPIDAKKLFQLSLEDELNSQDTSEKFLYPNVIISDFIVGVWDHRLWIKPLIHETTEWTDYLRKELSDYNRIQVQFCAKEIELMMKDTLTKAKSYLDNNEIRVIKKKSYYNGYLYTWIVEEADEKTFLTAWMYDHKALAWSKVGNKIQTFLSEIKLLTSEDIVAISPKGIFVWMAVKDHGIRLLYYWGSIKIAKPNANHYELIISQIEFLDDKLMFSKNSLPPPSYSQLISHPSEYCYMDTSTKSWFSLEDLLEYYMNNMFFLSLYGMILIRKLIRKKKFDKVVRVFDYSLEQALLSIKDGNIYTFTELIDNISALLVELEFFDENFGFSDRFLSKTSLLLPDQFEEVFLISQVEKPIEIQAKETAIKIDKYEEKLNKILDALEKLNLNQTRKQALLGVQSIKPENNARWNNEI
ncbi:14594_t:CDS:2 [Cetraspora pellucida]|uniref:14594_t:CDS:1 n=1 Tax=Cetraspora pellucida TaxID=1433469 RepID=A0ACA9K636_9GLOM|nr:14594_t:CDS:2 [Cetraspora pellucida]